MEVLGHEVIDFLVPKPLPDFPVDLGRSRFKEKKVLSASYAAPEPSSLAILAAVSTVILGRQAARNRQNHC
jgi:hypothetical protein